MLSSAITGIGLQPLQDSGVVPVRTREGLFDQRNPERSHLVKHRKQPEQFPAAVAVDIERRVCVATEFPEDGQVARVGELDFVRRPAESFAQLARPSPPACRGRWKSSIGGPGAGPVRGPATSARRAVGPADRARRRRSRPARKASRGSSAESIFPHGGRVVRAQRGQQGRNPPKVAVQLFQAGVVVVGHERRRLTESGHAVVFHFDDQGVLNGDRFPGRAPEVTLSEADLVGGDLHAAPASMIAPGPKNSRSRAPYGRSSSHHWACGS